MRIFVTNASSLLPFSSGATKNILDQVRSKRQEELHTSIDNLPMVEYTLRESLSAGLEAELGIESERLGNGQVCFDSEHGSSDAFLVAEYLRTMLIEAIVYAPNGLFGSLNLHCRQLVRMVSCTIKGTTTYQGRLAPVASGLLEGKPHT